MKTVTRISVFRSALLLSMASLVLAGAATAQQVAYSGKLQIGFGDQDNATGFRANNAMPVCAGRGAAVNPGTVGTTQGTLFMNGLATATPGVGGSIVFAGVQWGTGGAEIKRTSTCRESIPAFANPRLRSRTQLGSAFFPGRKGPFTPAISDASVPLTAPNYTLSLGGGNEEPTTVTAWTTRATFSAPPMSFTGAAYEASLPFFGAAAGLQRVQPGPGRFGGGLPFSGGAGLQLGVLFTTMANHPFPPNFGTRLYGNGLVPMGPLFIGTDAVGVEIRDQVTTALYTPSFDYPHALLAGRQNATFAARTPGGTTVDQQGAIRTIAGGNTMTPNTTVGPLAPIISPVAFTGVFGEWTTGAVTHTDRVGDFTTIRKAAGFDIAPTAGTQISNETRRIQLVSPWSANVRPVGPFGLPVPELGFGGVAVLTLNLIPAPEPGFALMLAGGASALATARLRRRKVS